MKKKKRNTNISRLIAVVFICIIAVGTALLSLPVSSRGGQGCGFRTALFTATSSTCVTGLILRDTWVQWSPFGQAVILCLIEIGGIGFMSVASSVIFILKRKVSMGQRAAIAVSVGSDDMAEAVGIQKKMLIMSAVIQIGGALILFLRFLKDYDAWRALKLGVFHAVSAFCNAGFDIFGFAQPGGSVSLYGTDTVVVITLSALIILGGMGYLVWDEVFFSPIKKRKSVYTRLVLITTAALLIVGTALIMIIEYDNPLTLGKMDFWDKLKAGFFQSATSRTAGFAGIDQGGLTDAGKAVTIFLMLIGGSSGSTAGGLKTVTFVVLFLFLISRLRGKDKVSVFYRNIPNVYILNALTLFGTMITLAFFGAVFISATSPVIFTDALYESVSALATVGLTAGATPLLSIPAQYLMILFMYFGRVGILTLALGFIGRSGKADNHKYADTDLLIG